MLSGPSLQNLWIYMQNECIHSESFNSVNSQVHMEHYMQWSYQIYTFSFVYKIMIILTLGLWNIIVYVSIISTGTKFIILLYCDTERFAHACILLYHWKGELLKYAVAEGADMQHQVYARSIQENAACSCYSRWLYVYMTCVNLQSELVQIRYIYAIIGGKPSNRASKQLYMYTG